MASNKKLVQGYEVEITSGHPTKQAPYRLEIKC